MEKQSAGLEIIIIVIVVAISKGVDDRLKRHEE